MRSPPKTALFVEGTSVPLPGSRNDLAELWRDLWRKSGGDAEQLVVHGFTKQQLVLMGESLKRIETLRVAGKVPLDALVALEYEKSTFDRLVVAFDALPANQQVVDLGNASCLRTERDFVLEHFAASSIMPPRFRSDARSLREHYEDNRGRPRARTRPPMGNVELVYMKPCFESLLLSDRSALMSVFGYESAPKNWRASLSTASRPDFDSVS